MGDAFGDLAFDFVQGFLDTVYAVYVQPYRQVLDDSRGKFIYTEESLDVLEVDDSCACIGCFVCGR